MRNLRRALSLALASVMVLGLMIVGSNAMTADFGDADQIDEQYTEAIDVLTTVGLIDGMNDDANSFNPVGTLRRSEAAKLLSVMLLGEANANKLGTNTQIFQDVPQGNWAAGYIAYCNSVGILCGNGDGTFNPDGVLTGVQFGKMLLVALGYNPEFEGYVNSGSAWEVNVAKDMLEAGIGVDDISFSDPISREQAAEMVFLAIQAPMVQYTSNNNFTSMQYVTTTIAKENTISSEYLSNTGLDGIPTYTIEFGERYLKDLVKDPDTSDNFGRPAYTWTYKNGDIGTYVDKENLKATYDTVVDGGKVYSDIGSVASKYTNINYYINGVLQDEEDIQKTIINVLKKNNETDFAASSQGTLTEVYVDDTHKTLDVIVIETYLAKVAGDYNKNREQLVIDIKNSLGADTIVAGGGPNDNTINRIYADDVDNLDQYKDGDVILVQIANGKVVNVFNPEKVEDTTITQFVKGPGNITTNEGQFSRARNMYNDKDSLVEYGKEELDGKTYDLYVDQYGNYIGLYVHSGSDKYVFVVGMDKGSSALSTKLGEAFVIFKDGTPATIKVNITESNKELSVDLPEVNTPNINKWYRYTVDSDEIYELRDLPSNVSQINGEAEDKPKNLTVENVLLKDKDNSKIFGYGNDDSVYITVEVGDKATDEGDAINKVTGTYTGVQDVTLKRNAKDPEIKKFDPDPDKDGVNDWDENVWAITNTDNGYIIAAIVWGEDNGTASHSIVYGLKGAQNESYRDGYYWWTFQAVVDGHISNLTVKTKYSDTIEKIQGVLPKAGEDGVGIYRGKTDKEAALLQLTYDKDGYVTEAEVLVDEEEVGGDIYGDKDSEKDIDPDTYTSYLVKYEGKPLQGTGRTLQDKTGKTMGLTLAAEAPVVVIQTDTNGELSIQEYSNITSALKSIENGASSFTGLVAASLNEYGTAKWIVIESNTPLTGKTTSDDDKKDITVEEVDLTEEGLKVTLSDKVTDANYEVKLSIAQTSDPGQYRQYNKAEATVTNGEDNATITSIPKDGTYNICISLYHNNNIIDQKITMLDFKLPEAE